MRITQSMMLNTALEAEATDTSRMAQLSQEASSGLAVSQPSDDPATWASIQNNQAEMGIIQARSTAASRAAGDLNLAESTLDSAGNLVTQAQSLAVEGANGTESDASRSDLATQVTSILQQLVALANTRGSSGYLFGGTNTNTPPVDSNGNYQGNADVTQVQIADGVLAVSNADGASAFSTLNGGRDVFADLQSLATALSSNDTAGIQASIGNLQTSNAQLVSARIATGLSAGRLTSASTVMSSALTQMQVEQANMQDADAPTTLSNLEAAQTAYEAALQVNRQILTVSLPDTSMS
jgi:flagellar hook-associated protein 3 FlgL